MTHTRTLAALATAAAFALTAPGFAAPAPALPHLLRTVSMTGDSGWDYLNADGPTQRLYIARGTRVQILSTATHKPGGEISPTQGIHGVALDTANNHGYVSDGKANQAVVFNIKTLKTLTTIPVGDRPDAIIYDPSSRRVFTFNGGGNSSTAIDTATEKVAGTIPLAGRPEYAVADGQGHVYVNLEDKSQIVEIDASALTVMHTWPLAPGDSPSGLTMDTQNRRLFSVCDNNKMIVMNADTGQIVATPAIGAGPDACIYDPSTQRIFSSNGEDGTLTVVHEQTPDVYVVEATIPTLPGARTITLDTTTHHLFLVTARAKPLPPGTTEGRRRTYVPGSFVVLEYGQ